MSSPSLEMFRSHLDMVLDTLLWLSLLGQGLGKRDPELLPTSDILGFWEIP